MEWWKLFSGTFVLIFLAELGDKTQLAAMAKTADSPGDSTAKWIVFLGASLALVASTFIAVFLGHIVKALVPDERYIKIAAGGLFLIFGFMILFETYRSFRGEKAEAPVPAAVAQVQPGLVGGLALRAAMDFESFASERYRRLAGAADSRLAKVLLSLAKEEDKHLARLRGMPVPAQAESFDAVVEAAGIDAEELSAGADQFNTLTELIHHEEATAEFYQALSKRALIPSLGPVFAKLADEEWGHATRLRDMMTRMSGRQPAKKA